jgi:glycerophosphoryl diester phosphodiesterase
MARENTLDSFRKAIQAGLDGVELDLHRTRDGVLAIHHDAEIRGIPIPALSWSELQQKAPWVPRLEAFLELLEEFPQAWANLELKTDPHHPDGRETLLAEQIRGKEDRIWVSTFDPFALIRLKRAGLSNLAFLYHQREALELLPCLQVQGVHPPEEELSPEAIQAFHEQGLFVVTWTVNRRERARELLSWGVDGIIGDDPEELLSARG